jgi:hypothetical protein
MHFRWLAALIGAAWLAITASPAHSLKLRFQRSAAGSSGYQAGLRSADSSCFTVGSGS